MYDNPLMETEMEQEVTDQTVETPQEQIPEETPAEEVSVEEISEEVPVETTEAEEASNEDAPQTEEISAQEAPQTGEASPEEASGEEAPPEEEKPLPYHERYYLKYKEGKRSTALDLEGTRAFLQNIGVDGGELRKAREGKDRFEAYQNVGKGKNNQMRCSYCGCEIAGVEFDRMPDGRMRCTTCSSTVVKTKAEVEELCRRVMDNMDNFFGARIDVPISIEVVDERKLKKKVGVPLGTRDSQSLLILGVAISKKKKYSIILENGAPRISLIATFAHELTHIWQYTHWDNNKKMKKCPKSKRLLIYEGMAKWAELQYLYLIGETTVAKREEIITRNRQDEYGIGFCAYDDVYPLSREAMTIEDTPFTPGRYPFD